MNSMTSAGPMANTMFMAAPHNAHSAVPGTTTQVTLYPHNQPQVNLIPGNQPGLQTPVSAPPAQRIFKEGKTLGALQILIGLLHFGLGSILGTMPLRILTVSFVGGYPFWGGISACSLSSRRETLPPLVESGCPATEESLRKRDSTWNLQFIISGSLSVASEEQPNYPCLLKGSLGVNILSAIFSVVGICLFVTDICINPHYVYPSSEVALLQIPSKATSGVLLIFSLLELFIASTCAHFGCQLISYDTVVYQTVYVSNQVPNPEPVNSPPSYSSDMQHSK